jgi:hypothetical protein
MKRTSDPYKTLNIGQEAAYPGFAAIRGLYTTQFDYLPVMGKSLPEEEVSESLRGTREAAEFFLRNNTKLNPDEVEAYEWQVKVGYGIGSSPYNWVGNNFKESSRVTITVKGENYTVYSYVKEKMFTMLTENPIGHWCFVLVFESPRSNMWWSTLTKQQNKQTV